MICIGMISDVISVCVCVCVCVDLSVCLFVGVCWGIGWVSCVSMSIFMGVRKDEEEEQYVHCWVVSWCIMITMCQRRRRMFPLRPLSAQATKTEQKKTKKRRKMTQFQELLRLFFKFYFDWIRCEFDWELKWILIDVKCWLMAIGKSFINYEF